MAANNQNNSLFKQYRGLTAIGLIFCFFLLPMGLLTTTFKRTASLKYKAEKETVFREMNDRLNFLAQHAGEDHYYHKLLNHYFLQAADSEKAVEKFEKSIRLLKTRFPEKFRFIVWNSKGQVVERLSDEKSYKYIINNLYAFFKEIAEHCRNNFPGTPETLPIVEKRLSIFRTILGRFLVPSHLRLPFQTGELGRCILTETHERFPLIWFNSKGNLTVFAAVKTDLSRQNPGILHATEYLNSDKSIIKTGFVDMRNIQKLSENLSFNEQRQLLLNLGKFENAAMPGFDTEDLLMSFKMLTPKLRGFCLVRKADMLTGNPEKEAVRKLAATVSILLILAWIGFCFSLRLKNLTLSIRLRTIILFVYANGLPLLILATIGTEYLQQKEASLIQEIHRQNEKLLQEIDNGYRRYRDSLSRQTRLLLKDFSEKVKERLPDRTDLPELERILNQLDADEVVIFGKGGETLINFRKNRKVTSQTFVRMFATTALNFANQTGTDFFSDEKSSSSTFTATSNSLLKENSAILKDLLATLENTGYYTFGTDQKLCFARLLGNKEQRRFNSVMIIFWLKEDTQATYAQKTMSELNNAASTTSFASLAIHNGFISTDNRGDTRQLRPWLQKAYNLQTAKENNLYIKGKRHVLTAISGKQLNNMALSAVTPADSAAAEIANARLKIYTMAVISLMISAGVVLTLVRQFINPVRQLTEAVRQMGRRNFSFRTEIQSNDEFADLGQVFNKTISEMADLELGRVVQEELFPGNQHYSGKLQIYAKTSTMTKLGGDYYDFFDLNDCQTGIFMGDVAGHGIPAALIMAMAKATVITCSQKRHDPSLLLSALHQMLFRLKSDGFKRMMTCQYLVINNQNGHCNFTNAGHCYPVTVSCHGKSASFTELDGAPVGIAKRARYDNHPLQLNPGETMILYSDGMLEATNAAGEIFGANRFLKLVCDCWHDDLSVYYQNLFNANAEWAGTAEDDITIVLVRLGMEGINA